MEYPPVCWYVNKWCHYAGFVQASLAWRAHMYIFLSCPKGYHLASGSYNLLFTIPTIHNFPCTLSAGVALQVYQSVFDTRSHLFSAAVFLNQSCSFVITSIWTLTHANNAILIQQIVCVCVRKCVYVCLYVVHVHL